MLVSYRKTKDSEGIADTFKIADPQVLPSSNNGEMKPNIFGNYCYVEAYVFWEHNKASLMFTKNISVSQTVGSTGLVANHFQVGLPSYQYFQYIRRRCYDGM